LAKLTFYILKKRCIIIGDKRNKDISVLKLINYNLLFFIPLIILYIISYYLSGLFSPYLEVSPVVTTQILMVVLSLVTFFILIPLLRIRETVRGVRFSLFNFAIIGFVITIPSLINGNYGILMSALIYLANFIFATFINSPDVIGISGDPDDWFKHKVQIMIFVIYLSIVLLYVFGFAWINYQMAIDKAHPNAFDYANSETPSYMTFSYYSIVTMATVGYGDITPVSPGARLVMAMHTLLGMIINVVFIAILLMYVTFSATRMEKRTEKRIEKEEKEIEREAKELEREEDKILKEEKKIEEMEENRIRADSVSNAMSRRYPNYLDGRNNLK